MIEDIKAGHIKNVLIFKLDRLTRSVADLVYLIDLFKNYGCAFNSLSESIDTSTASGRMFIKIIGIFAEFERENIGERVRLGKERKAKEGFTTACAVPSYGYNRGIGEKVQTINEEEAETVRRIFDLYVNQNTSLNGIAKVLNAEKIPTKQGTFWNSGGIITLLKNPNYVGNVRYSMENPERYFEAEGKHEAIINEELFREAQALIEKNKRATPTKRGLERNYFIGLLYCGLCGRKLKPHMAVSRSGKTEYNFICSGRVPGACTAKMVTARKIENAVYDYISNIPDIVPDTEKEEKERQAAAARIEILQNKLTGIDAKEKDITDLYLEDNATLAEYRSVKTMLDGERGKLLTEIEKLTPKELNTIEPKTRDEIILTFKSEWHNYTDIEKRQFLVKHISKITLTNQPIKGRNEGKCEVQEVIFNS
jgi:site-specific DNA recombinase